MAPLTRTGSLTSLNALPEDVRSQADLKATLSILRQFCGHLELQLTVPSIPRAELSGAPLQQALKAFIPKVTAAFELELKHSKALSKIVASITSAIAYLESPAHTKDLLAQLLASPDLERMIDERVQTKLAEVQGGRRTGRSALPETPRAQRKMQLEHAIHYVVHKLVGKQYTRFGKAVISELTEWPEMEVEGFVEEEIEGTVVRRWRPDWDFPQTGSPFEAAVLQVVRDEYPGTFNDDELRVGLESYALSIARSIKEENSGLLATRKATTNINKRRNDLRDIMRENFESSILNVCAERNFYSAMINSGAFLITRLGQGEPHGLKRYSDPNADGQQYGYNEFELFADLWFTERVDPGSVWVALDVEWWSPQCRRAFWLLFSESKPKPGKPPRTPIFHVPYSRRTIVKPADLPRLPPPAVQLDLPSASKKSKLSTFPLTKGMVNNRILTDVQFESWRTGLRDDPELDTDYRPLDELLDEPANQALAAAASQHLRAPVEFGTVGLRKLWKARGMLSADVYLGVLRAEDPIEKLAEIDLDEADDDLYA